MPLAGIYALLWQKMLRVSLIQIMHKVYQDMLGPRLKKIGWAWYIAVYWDRMIIRRSMKKDF